MDYSSDSLEVPFRLPFHQSQQRVAGGASYRYWTLDPGWRRHLDDFIGVGERLQLVIVGEGREPPIGQPGSQSR